MSQPLLIPTPRFMDIQPGTCALNGTSILYFNDTNDSYPLCGDLIKQRLTKLVILPPETKLSQAPSLEIIIGTPSNNPGLLNSIHDRQHLESLQGQEEAYLLEIHPGKILVAGSTDRGVFYGVQTLLQLLDTAPDKTKLSCLTIFDYPLMPIRGLSDDISRGQISTLEDFKNIIRRLAYFKINYYLPYIEDMFEFETYPDIGIDRERLSKKETRELVAFAKQYHVEIVPVFECLGHQDRILTNPKFNALAENPEKPWSFCPAKEDIYPFLDNCIRELAGVFTSRYFCIGCDETWDLGKFDSKPLADIIGIDGVYAQHIVRLKEILASYGKEPWLYGDMPFEPAYPQLKDKIPKDILMINWDYCPKDSYPRADSFQEWGFGQIVSPGVHCWGRFFPDMDEATRNADTLIPYGYQHGATGEIQSSWCDFGGESFRESNWYLYTYSAELGWNPQTKVSNDFDQRYSALFYGTLEPAVLKIHHLLGESNKYFKFYYATTALALWEDQVNPKCTELIQDRETAIQFLHSIHQEVLALLPSARMTVTRHRDHLKIFELTHQRIELLALRLELPLRKKVLDDKLADESLTTDLKTSFISDYNDFIDELLTQLSRIQQKFEEIWLFYNHPPMIDFLLAKYDGLEQYVKSQKR